ncbi:MAG: dihydroxy-acid dehydratase, partial [Candidatus Omnitrophica bacterium]|nr:dihydroxy-acid dehydratase [Candidatus Omnitrophota bacterium]
IVLSGCDKSPFGVLNGLVNLDLTRLNRGDHPLLASFIPSHVLKGGTIPQKLESELRSISEKARKTGHENLADDIDETLDYILQCSSNQAFQGILQRCVQVKLISAADHKRIEKELAINTCDSQGGICAFYGTGNSSRIAVSSLGLVHPDVELLTEPPTQGQIQSVVKSLFSVIQKAEFSISNIVSKNIENSIRVMNATGGSTNLVKHMVAAMLYAGYRFDLWDYQRIRNAHPIPDIFDYSLTKGRDIFALAQQCCDGKSRGVETMINTLVENEVPMALAVPTISGQTWKQRLGKKGKGLSADSVTDNPIILAKPRRAVSGIEVFRGNFFESAVLKLSGFTDAQTKEFDNKVFYVLYFESEDEANKGLADARLIEALKQQKSLSKEALLAMIAVNRTDEDPTMAEVGQLNRSKLFNMMIDRRLFKVAVVIAGQGPEAFGMPEMFTPMQLINSNHVLRKMAILLSDGRFSGVTYGAAFGHATPEAIKGGHLLYLKTGDMIRLQMGLKRIEMLNPQKARNGTLEPYAGSLDRERYVLGAQRLQRMEKRREALSPTNRLENVTDASQGVVPDRVAKHATKKHASKGSSYKIRNARRQSQTEQQVA